MKTMFCSSSFTQRVLIMTILAWGSLTHAGDATTWTWPGGDLGGGHYSEADQITPANVKNLKVAWTHRSGDFREGDNFREGISGEVPLQSSWQATPILMGDNLIICTPFNRIIAVDSRSGEERWSYTPDGKIEDYPMPRCRGVTQWVNTDVAPDALCHHVVIAPVYDARVIGLDATRGTRCSFGDHADIDLSLGLGDYAPSDYMLNTPPAIAGDLLVTGGSVVDNLSTNVPSGVVRAYDLNSGELVWDWEPLLEKNDPLAEAEDAARSNEQEQPHHGASTKADYQRGTTNVWSYISVDLALNRVYVPTGNTSPDYYGGHRNGSDYYSSSVVALDLDSGEVIWHFQTVHHDIWDFDAPSQPTLFDYQDGPNRVLGLAQTTKQGYVFLLNRETGEPLFPVVETPVPQSAVLGDYTAATQPVPTKPRSLFEVPGVTEKVWGLTFWDEAACADTLANLRYEGPFTPASEQGSLHMPSAFGGQNWGGPAIDPERATLVVNTQHLGTIVQLIPRDQCEEGSLPDPVAHGLFLDEPSKGTPYCDRRWLGFISPLGAPCTPPPWGTLAGIDIVTGDVKWQVPLGTSRDMAPFPFWFIDGAPNIGGPTVTQSGLTFIAATTDYFLRAFATDTGEELWKGRLPTSAHGLPVTYETNDGDQYVVIAAGGHAALGTPPGDYLIAYTLDK